MKKKSSIFRLKSSNGFTLIEMIVSLAIFSIVAVVALGALMKIISANKKAQSLQSAMTNINYALESMSREMRVGSNFCLNNHKTSFNHGDYGSCSNGTVGSNDNSGTVIAFKSSKVFGSGSNACNLTYAYSFSPLGSPITSWDFKKAAQSNDCVGALNNNDFTSIIDSNVIITGYYVNITSATYPLATIRISGYVGAREQERTYFDIQTAVSARIASGQ